MSRCGRLLRPTGIGTGVCLTVVLQCLDTTAHRASLSSRLCTLSASRFILIQLLFYCEAQQHVVCRSPHVYALPWSSLHSFSSHVFTLITLCRCLHFLHSLRCLRYLRSFAIFTLFSRFSRYESSPSPDPPPGSPAPHAVAYKPTSLRVGSDGSVTGVCPQPPSGQWVACFLDVEFEGGFRFTTQVTMTTIFLFLLWFDFHSQK
jgi:hypothetical protein